MKRPRHLKMRSLLLACCLAAAYPAAQAEETSATTSATETTDTSTASTTTTVGTSSNTEAKLTAEFADFLGGEAQAQSVVSGLRQGTAFDLVTETTTTDSSGKETTTTTTTTIDPPTDTMGYGNVRITLRLAEAQLSQMGITDPTAEELSAVLLGGEINGTQVNGILTLRADGMGWGQIAQEYGMTVGQIMGKGTGLTKQTATPTTASQAKATGKAGSISSATTKSGQTSQARSNGYIPSSSKSASASQTHSNGYIPSGSGKSNGAVVTAAGASLGGSGNGVGKGLAPKSTASSQGSGTVSAGGSSNAMAPGQTKKN
jgi:hypothetical protein